MKFAVIIIVVIALICVGVGFQNLSSIAREEQDNKSNKKNPPKV